jgi:hypothetical protein
MMYNINTVIFTIVKLPMQVSIGKSSIFIITSTQLAEEKKKAEKKMPFVENIVVKVYFLYFQANIFSLLFKPKDSKFAI